MNKPSGPVAGDQGPRRRRLTQAESRKQTRRQLLGAAARIFAEKGFAGASLEEISELAGYTTGALYYHFSGKDELFLELVRSGWSRNLANRVAAVRGAFGLDGAPDARHGPDAPDAIDASDRPEAAAGRLGAGGEAERDPFDTLASYVVNRGERESELAALSAEFWLYAFRHPEAMEMIADTLREQTEALEPVIAGTMARRGTAPGISSGEMTLVALVLFDGLVRRRRIDPATVPDDLFARILRRLLDPATGKSREESASDPASGHPA